MPFKKCGFILDPIKPRIVRPGKPRTIPPRDDSPVSVTIGDNVTVLTDSDLTIHCPATGSPMPEITWTKNGNKMSLGNMVNQLGNGTLVIRKVSVDESGTYTCTATNIAGKSNGTTNVDAVGRSSIKMILCIFFKSEIDIV